MIIKCLKEKKQSLILGTCIFCFAMIGPFFSRIDIESKIGLSVLALFIYIICLPVFLSPLQWYIISEESIVVRNVFRVVNRVDFENVKLIYKKRLPK